MVREVKIQGGVRGTRKNSGLARCEEVVNGRCSFTARELFCFMRKESLVRYAEMGRMKRTRVSDVTVERLLSTAGLNKEQLEERMIQAAFEAFAPGRPVIPSERYMMVLSCRRTAELGKAYNFNSKLPWTTLRGQLNTERREIITAYRDSLRAETDSSSEHASAPMGKPIQSGFDSSAVKLRRSQEIKESVASISQVPCESDWPSQAVAGPSRAPLIVPTSRVPVFHPESRHHELVSETKDRNSPHASSGNQVVVDRLPSLPADLKDNFMSPRPARDSADRNSLDIRAYLRSAPVALEVDDYSAARRREINCKRKMGETVKSDRANPNQGAYQQASLELQELGTAGKAEEAVTERKVSHLTLSTLTNVYDVLQLAASSARQEERPGTQEDECEDWSEDDDINVGTSSHPSGSRPVENCTLRKLAELRDRLKQEKEAGGRMQRERHDLLSSPDSDYSVTGAFRSPRQTRHSCAFTFRGYRIDAPATAERVQRRRRPIWYVREDPGSPTPIRTTLPLPQTNVFSREEPAPHPASTSSCHVYDDESIVDMDFTGALPLATPPPKVRRRRKPRQ